MAQHLASSYGPALQRAEIADPAMRTLLAEHEGAPVGFAQLRRSVPPACVTSPEPVEILRFYVDRPWHGRGVAQRLMEAALAEASALGAASVWLGVWEHNPRAAAFYRKYGFVEVGAQEFVVGQDRQRDLVMLRRP
jgi:GNAT superfamily N-acetyltransferase